MTRRELDGLPVDRLGRLHCGEARCSLHRGLPGEVERFHDLGEVARGWMIAA